MIVFADPHLREESAETVFEQVLPGLYHAALQDKDKTLACLGDFWHVRNRVSVKLQNRVVKFLETLNSAGINFILLPGNHDQINVEGENALEVFGKLPNVTVYTEPTWDQWGFWVPYRKRNEDIISALREAELQLPSGVPPILWMHQGVNGALMTNSMADTKGLDAGQLHKWLVFTGHYHGRQALGNIQYIGSPYQTTASEAGQDKGYSIWDKLQMKMEHVNTEWGKRYHNLGLVDPASVDLSGIREGDEVRAVAPLGVAPEELGRLLGKSGGRCVVTPSLESTEGRLTVGDRAGLPDYAREYVNQFAGTLDKDKLMAVYLSTTDR